MADLRPEYANLLDQRKATLEDKLSGLLPPKYKDRLTGNPNAGLLEGAFKRIEPGEDPYKFVKDWHNYDPSWNKGKSAATALRMLLTKQIGLPRYDVIVGYTKPTLAKIICGIEAADSGVPREEDIHAPLTLPEDIELPLSNPPKLPETSAKYSRNIIPLTDISSIISTYGNPSGKFAAYVLDCTPDRFSERNAMWQLRRDTLAKNQAGHDLGWKGEFAQALNEGERVYYVGSTEDVNRMNEHQAGSASGGAKFTNFFKPRGVFDITWFDSEAKAQTVEAERASELTRPGESRAYHN